MIDEGMYCMENNKICPMLSIFTITSGIPRLNRSGVNALGRKLIRVRLKNMGGNVSQIPFLMMSVVVIFTIESMWLFIILKNIMVCQLKKVSFC